MIDLSNLEKRSSKSSALREINVAAYKEYEKNRQSPMYRLGGFILFIRNYVI
jgi:hypothetical protein